MKNNFFNEQSLNSDIKTQIILATFKLWLQDNKKEQNLSYIDLFSGPGIYDDGTLSTPICILQEICNNKRMAQRFNVILNDYNAEFIAKLRRMILNVKNARFIKTLVTSIGNAESFQKTVSNNEHIFMLIDPWGWKGINRNYINNMLLNKDCDIAVMFNFNQFNRFMNFDIADELFNDLFDKKTLHEIRKFCSTNPKSEREQFVIDKFVKMVCKNCENCNYTPFKFKMEKSTRTSHYIIFIIRDKDRFQATKTLLNQYLA